MTGGVRALMWGEGGAPRSVQINRFLPERRRHPHGAILETQMQAISALWLDRYDVLEHDVTPMVIVEC